MPVVSITLMEGYSEETREKLGHALTDAVRGTIGAPLDGTTVQIYEVPAANYMRGRVRRTPGTPPPSASDVVRGYLDAMEARDLDAAKEFLGDGFHMAFPGPVVFSRPEELTAWAKDRYNWVKKSYDAFHEAPFGDGAVVTCYGTLYGEWPDGSAFEDIRFVDVFTVSGGKIADQKVWNDLAEHKANQAL